MILAFIIP